MKYYQVDVSSEPEVIGVTNGIHQIKIDKKEIQNDENYNLFLRFFNYNNKDFWKKQNEIEKLQIPPINAILLKKAKVTDIMGYTENISFLNNVYSEKFIDILKAFNIGRYKTFEVIIKDVNQRYFMLFIETLIIEEINFKNSLLYTGFKPRNSKIQYYKVENYNQYKEFIKQIPIHDFEKVSIPHNYSSKDIIKIQPFSSPFYSERLIDFLIDCGITGLEVNYKNSIQLEFI